ncbi:hypothetical protein DH2020_001186 [Rehmannia glutinosa]|uniref:Uncharacterized protein n=1 Tax=Rehmannia glutinosa TaxID=99300 RepID=A0ABR0XYL6_REHGL
MVNSEKRQFTNDQRTDDVNQTSGDDESVNVSLSGRNDRENDVLQWIGALDMRVMGACRADERLKPLLKLNVSTDFEPSVGHLAKCLCVPLVSIRVGKINKQGTFLSPTSEERNLCLILLPTSELRISFIGDDGSMERLATLSSDRIGLVAIEIEEISRTTRSELLKKKDKLPVANGINPFATLNFVDAFGKSAELPFSSHKIQVPSSGQSHFSPQYCWCPQYALGNSQHLPVSSTESLSLPPLSSLLSTVRRPSSSLLISIPSLNLTEVPPVDFPSLLPEPLVRLQTSQNIPTFTPLMCDPIVHVPMFEVCSSGSGYLVSAGPTMSTTFPPLNPKLMDPLLPNPESLLEKSARETLRMLMSNNKQNVFATGSRGLYSGAGDVDAIPSSSMTNMRLVFLSEKPFKICPNRDDSVDEEEKPSSSGFEF